jgi:MFS family permease
LHAAYKWFPDEWRAIPSAVISQGAAIGVVIAIPLLNSIITTYNWHYAFGALGIIGLVWVIAWAVLGKEGCIEEPAATEGPASGKYNGIWGFASKNASNRATIISWR